MLIEISSLGVNHDMLERVKRKSYGQSTLVYNILKGFGSAKGELTACSKLNCLHH